MQSMEKTWVRLRLLTELDVVAKSALRLAFGVLAELVDCVGRQTGTMAMVSVLQHHPRLMTFAKCAKSSALATTSARNSHVARRLECCERWCSVVCGPIGAGVCRDDCVSPVRRL